MNPEELLKATEEKKFERVINGYRPAQVRNYLKRIVKHYESLYQEKETIEKEILKLKEEQSILKQTLFHAQETANKIMESARIEAHLEKEKAKKEAEKILKVAKEEEAKFNQTLSTMKAKYNSQIINLTESFYFITKEHVQALEREFLTKTKEYFSDLNIKQPISENIITTNPIHSKEASNQTFKLIEESILVGNRIKEDIVNDFGEIIVTKNQIITPKLISEMINKGLYGELVSALGDIENELG